MTLIDISKMSKAEVLMRLYNGGINRNHGILAAVLQPRLPAMTLEYAEQLVQQNEPELYFDYVQGKALKVDLRGDMLDPRLYDRDCGEGAAAKALGVER